MLKYAPFVTGYFRETFDFLLNITESRKCNFTLSFNISVHPL